MCKSAFYLLLAAIVVFNVMEYVQADYGCTTVCLKYDKFAGGLKICSPGYRRVSCPGAGKNMVCGMTPNGPGCRCRPGWTGQNCDVRRECQNNGVKKITPRGIRCSCPAGFEGIYCQYKTRSSQLACSIDQRLKCDRFKEDCKVTTRPEGYVCYCKLGRTEDGECRN